MTERDALYAAVLAEPEADAPRLVYADWLEEHPRDEADAARAHFIRLEVEAEQLPVDSPDRAAMEAAAAKLFNRHGDEWNRDLPAWGEWYDSALVYRRGFPHELSTVLGDLTHGDGRLFTTAPLRAMSVRLGTRLLELVNGPRLMNRELLDLSRLRSLWVGPGFDLAGEYRAVQSAFRITASYPTLTALERLSFAGNGLDDDDAFALAEALEDAVFRPSLVELDLSDNLIRDAGATTLSVVPPLARLRRLILTGNPLTDFGRRMLRNHFGDRVVF